VKFQTVTAKQPVKDHTIYSSPHPRELQKGDSTPQKIGALL